MVWPLAIAIAVFEEGPYDKFDYLAGDLAQDSDMPFSSPHSACTADWLQIGAELPDVSE